MKSSKLFVYTILLLSMVNLWQVSGEKNASTFIPTREWQPVKKGQPIPSGLHVRYNFQTGITEAKLLDPDEEKEEKKNTDVSNNEVRSLTLHSDASDDGDDNSDDGILSNNNVRSSHNLKMSLEELKTRLKNIKSEDSNNNKLKNSFRSYEELKRELKEIEMNVTSDSAILKNLFKEFKDYEDSIATGILQKNQIDDILQIFNDFEYLLHQVDNAQIFADMDGMEKIISPCLNVTNDSVKMEALRVFGTAVQSNPKVQLKALENDFIPKLLHILISGNNKTSLRSRCLFALSALIRLFPAAQKIFIDHGGLEIFTKILEEGHLQLQLRVMKLMSELAIERKNIKYTEDIRLKKLKTHEYEKTNFEQKLVVHKYCKSLSNIIKNNIKESLSIDSVMEMYDFFEVTFENMITLSSTCKYEFRDPENNLLMTLNSMMDYYSILNDTRQPEDIEMYENLAKQISQLRTSIFDDIHDEL